MDEDESIFPMDIIDRDPSFRPWNFRPQGYLVVILSTSDEAHRAETALVGNGFASKDIKLYTGEQILKTNEGYTQRRGVASKAMGVFGDDVEGRELYLSYAREDHCAMWVRIPDEADVPKALRILADYDYLHARHYGDESQHDFHIS
jgi:hypothetical protein